MQRKSGCNIPIVENIPFGSSIRYCVKFKIQLVEKKDMLSQILKCIFHGPRHSANIILCTTQHIQSISKGSDLLC